MRIWTRYVWGRLLLNVLIALPLFAGNGKINPDGTVDLTVDIRFAPTQGQIDLIRDRMTGFSERLWDASEGQMRLRNVQINCGTADEDLADIWFSQQLFAVSAEYATLGEIGAHYVHTMDHGATVIFHEFGHYGLKLKDEYPVAQKQCGGRGPCFDLFGGTNECIMVDTATLDTEFCVAQNHDPKRGNNPNCLPPCGPDKCQFWDVQTQQMEASAQQMEYGKSCWETLADLFPFLELPNGLPQAAPPPGFVAPDFLITCGAASSIVLVLDKSGSMGEHINLEKGEVCGNQKDDDGDGTADESDCGKARIEFVHAAARQLIDAAASVGARYGIVSLESSAQVVSPIVALDETKAAELKTLTDALAASGGTAIGAALLEAKKLLDAEPGNAAGKAILIVTDGKNTVGPNPADLMPIFVDSGIRIFPIATGQAADDPTLEAIANTTSGMPFSSPQPSQMLMAANEAWAQYTAAGHLLPKSAWAGSAKRTFRVEPGTTDLTVAVTAEMPAMRRFGVVVRLTDPNGKVFSTATPPASMRVIRDPFFLRATLSNPAAGRWRLSLTRARNAAAAQHGSLAVTSTNDDTRLGAWVRHEGSRATMTLRPWHAGALRHVDWNVVVRRPDGSTTRVMPRGGEDGVYTITLDDLRTPGTYAIEATFATNERTRTVTTERVPRARSVPRLQRTVTRYITVSR